MQHTSLQAYYNLKNIGPKQKACWNSISYQKKACNQDIAKDLGWEINRVTPRVKELRELKLVEESHRDINPKTGRTVIYWKIKEDYEN